MPVTTPYENWMRAQGIPILGGHGVSDVREVERRPWAFTGGRAAFIDLQGMEGLTGMYVGEIPPGGALRPLRHLHEQLVYILAGRGAAEVWLAGDEGRKATFEWQEGSLFAIPLNCCYRLFNGGSEPAVYLAVNDAPLMMDLLHNDRFLFENDFAFTDRFAPGGGYFDETDGGRSVSEGQNIWETNFVADVRRVPLQAQERKGVGARITQVEPGGSSVIAHLAEWPVGRYHKGHYHGGGAILLIVRSCGYTTMWSNLAGVRPYAAGRENAVVRVDWGVGAVFSPPSGWYHQHFNTGPEPALQLAFRFGSQKHPRRWGPGVVGETRAVYVSQRDGGTMIEYEDEDPLVRHDFLAALSRNGVAPDMPAWAYRQ